eukprot:scpid78880/ scgid32165/ 
MASAPAVCAMAKPESIDGMRVSRRVRCIQIESVGRITLDVVERGLDGWREETVILAVVCIREDTFLEGGGGQIADRILETKELHERAYCIESLTPQGTSMTVFRLATSLSSEISGELYNTQDKKDFALVANYQRSAVGTNKEEDESDQIKESGLFAIFNWPGHEPLTTPDGALISRDPGSMSSLTRIVIQQVNYSKETDLFLLHNAFLGLRPVTVKKPMSADTELGGIMMQPAMVSLDGPANTQTTIAAMGNPLCHWHVHNDFPTRSNFKLYPSFSDSVVLCRQAGAASKLVLCEESAAKEGTALFSVRQPYVN